MKRLLVLTLALLATVTTEAQSRRDSGFHSTVHLIGPRSASRSGTQLWVIGSGGASRLQTEETLPSNTSRELKNQNVFGGGILFEAGRFQMTGQTGLFFFQEGVSRTFTATTGSKDFRIVDLGHLSYLGIPAVARWNPIRRGRTRFSISGGLMPAALVGIKIDSRTETQEAGTVSVLEEHTTTESPEIRKFNVTALAAIGGDIGLNRDQDMRLELVYRRGLLSIHEDEKIQTFTNSLVMNLGFGFDI